MQGLGYCPKPELAAALHASQTAKDGVYQKASTTAADLLETVRIGKQNASLLFG